MRDYIKKMRQKIGHQKIIHPAARIIIQNELGEVLFIRRKDNEKLGIPAGAFEENETIKQCIIREVKEETGIEILELELIGLSSNPDNELVSYNNGDMIQYFTCEFYSNQFKGNIKGDAKEVSLVQFLHFDNFHKLPLNEKRTFDSLDFYRKKKRVRVT